MGIGFARTVEAMRLRIVTYNIHRAIGVDRRFRPDRVGKILAHHAPDLILLQAGCDPLKGDPQAGLSMTRGGLVERDAMVFEEARRRGIPILMTLGGGYSKQAWQVQYESIRRQLQAN